MILFKLDEFGIFQWSFQSCKIIKNLKIAVKEKRSDSKDCRFSIRFKKTKQKIIISGSWETQAFFHPHTSTPTTTITPRR